MKITKQQLKRIIKEEKRKLIKEQGAVPRSGGQWGPAFEDEISARESDKTDRINSLAQAMFAAYNNVAAALDDAEDVLPSPILLEVEQVLDTLEQVSEKVSAITRGTK